MLDRSSWGRYVFHPERTPGIENTYLPDVDVGPRSTRWVYLLARSAYAVPLRMVEHVLSLFNLMAGLHRLVRAVARRRVKVILFKVQKKVILFEFESVRKRVN